MALSIPHVFVNGVIAEASEVNANFSAVKTFVDGLAAGTNLNTGSVATAKIADGAVTTVKLASAAVSADKVAVGAITADKILDANVTGAKLANLVVDAKTDDYTLVAGDRNKRIVANKATAVAFTVDDSVHSAGDVIEIHNINTGLLTLTAGAGVTINGADVLTVAQWQGGSLYFISASSAIWFPTAKRTGILQVASAFKSDTFSYASASYTDITGLSVSITPATTASKILITFNVQGQADSNNQQFRILRGSTAIGVADTAGNRVSGFVGGFESALGATANVAGTFLDSPATTSSTTYKIQVRNNNSGANGYINRAVDDTNAGPYQRMASSITVLEVAQ